MTRITKECARGHVFEPDFPDSDDCPYCAQMDRGYKSKKTLALYPDQEAGGATPAGASPGARGPTVASPNVGAVGRSRTLPIYATDVEEPVAGWLVATVGPLRGKDFRVPMGRSSFGRDLSCRICITGDPTVSSHQGFINYSRNRKFTISPGEGTSLLYVNGQEVLSPIELSPYDVLEMGNTTMAFIPFCGKDFDWFGESN